MSHYFLLIGDKPWRDETTLARLCAMARQRGAIFVAPESMVVTSIEEVMEGSSEEEPFLLYSKARWKIAQLIVAENISIVVTMGGAALRMISGHNLPVRLARTARRLSPEGTHLVEVPGLADIFRIGETLIFPSYHPRDITRRGGRPGSIVDDLVKAFIALAV